MTGEVFAPDTLGGAGRWLHEVARYLVMRGNRITLVIRRARPELPAQEIIDDIRVFRYGNIGKKSLFDGISCFLQGRNLIGRILKKETFDICHICQPFSGLIAVFSALAGKPKVYSYFSPWHHEFLVDHVLGESPGINPRYWIRYLMERFIVRRCRKLIVLSDYSLGQVGQYHDLKNRCIKIPGGIDIKRFSPPNSKEQVRNEVNIPPCPLFLFTARNLRQRMGLFQLIEAISLLKSKIAGIKCAIAGRGPLKNDLESKISEYALESSVKLLGEVSEKELPLYYQAADLFLLPTQKLEGFGLVTLEALACGTPVVATPISANREVVGGLDKKFLAAGTESKDLADTIYNIYQELVEGKIDFKACRKYAEKFSWQHVSEQVENCYRNVINNS